MCDINAAKEELRNYHVNRARLEAMRMQLEQLEDSEQQRRLKNMEAWCALVARALQSLKEDERAIIEALIMNKERGAVQRLCNTLHYSESSIYKKRRKALERVATCLQGIKPPDC